METASTLSPPADVGGGEKMSICIGVKNDVCGVEFYDPDFPNDNVCDKCAIRLEEEA